MKLTDEELSKLWCSIPTVGHVDADVIAFGHAVAARAREAAAYAPVIADTAGAKPLSAEQEQDAMAWVSAHDLRTVQQYGIANATLYRKREQDAFVALTRASRIFELEDALKTARQKNDAYSAQINAQATAQPIAYLSTNPAKWDQCRIKQQGDFTVPVHASPAIDAAQKPACTCKGVLGHSRQCAAFDEAMMRPAIDASGASIDMTYEQIAEKLSNDGYSKQADVIRQIVKMESGK